MKNPKILLTALFLLIATAVLADDGRPISVDRLPQPARQFIERCFGERKIALAKMEIDFMKKSYEVIFSDGCRIEFDSKGNWTEIDCRFSEVPSDALPAPMLSRVKADFPDTFVVKIERDRREYELKLSNRVELTFDSHFNLVDIDY